MTDLPRKSSVLRCYDSPDHCLICKFIDGDRSEEAMLETIRILDATLASDETHIRRLEKIIGSLLRKLEHVPSKN